MTKDDPERMSKAARKQARRELAAQPRDGATTGAGFAGLAAAARHPPSGERWLARERAWVGTERAARRQLSWFFAAALALPALFVWKTVLMDPMGYTPTQTLAAQGALAAMAALAAWVLWRGTRPVQNPIVDVWERRRAEVVWAYVNDHTTLAAGATFRHQSATLALADGSSVATQTQLAPGDFGEIAAGLPGAAIGYSDARRAAFTQDPRSVR